MGFIDWIKGAASKVADGAKWLGGKIGQGIEWVDKNVAQPALSFARNIPVVGSVVDAAKPITDLGSKIGQALQGKARLSLGDVTGAIGAVPGTIAAGQGALAQGAGYLARAAAMGK